MGHRVNRVRIDRVVPYGRAKIGRGVELIPTPGHTPGQFSTLVKVGRARMLFTGDFVWREDGEWRPGNASRKRMSKSFNGLRGLAFDYVVPWTSYAHTEFFVPVRSVEAVVDAMIAACRKP